MTMVPQDADEDTLSLADYFNVSSQDLGFGDDHHDSSLGSFWGPRRDSLYIVVPITVIYAIIFVTGVIGNVSTCVVISRNKSMHTATNYYLFSLAVSDLLLLVSGLPPEMYYIWYKYPYIFGEAFCVLQGFAAETSANATVLTITAFTMERYVAICHPFLSHTMSKLSRAIKFVMAIWVLAMCLAVPQAMSFGIIYQDSTMLDDNHYVCAVKRQIIPHAFELSTLVFFVLPMSLISVLYVLIALQLRKSRIVQKGSLSHSVELKHRTTKTHSGQALQTVLVSGEDQQDEQSDGRKNYHRNTHSKATKHVVNMLVAVVVAFFICWAPFHAQRLLAIHAYADRTPDIVALYTCLTYLSGVLYYLSTCINPFLYNIMSNKFRNAFRETLSRYVAIGGHSRTPVRRYSTLSLPRSISPTRSQSLSQSGGISGSASLRRGRDSSDMARRPLVVSFRKPRSNLPNACIHAPRCACRINYVQRNDHPTIEETCVDAAEPPAYNIHPKVRLFRKWGRKKHVGKKACKVICSECHRHLSNESELHNKMTLSQEFSSSSGYSESKVIQKDCPVSAQIRDDLQLESDLIPRHMCPNQHDSRLSGLPNGCVPLTGVSHSKTMPDIVKFAMHARKKSSPRSECGDNPSDSDLSKAKVLKANPARRWGSAEMLKSFDVT